MIRKLRFPALNFHGGRIELIGRTEAACAVEALAIYRAVMAARVTSAEGREGVGFTECAPTGSICDMHLRVGLILLNAETGEPYYEANP